MMHDSALHLTEDELHDAADGTGVTADPSPATRHLMHCARCRTDVDRIRELLALAAALPRSIEPPAHLWSGIQESIRRQPAVRPRGVAASRSRWEFARDGRWLAAAAVLLIVASSAMTTLLLRSNANDVASASGAAAPLDPRQTPIVQPVSDEYGRVDRELAALLAQGREKMHPETIARVERNLAIIDEAIAEIRQALIDDPGNDALRQLLKASYGQKSALVRQVSAS